MKRLYPRVNICYLLYGLIFVFFGIAVLFQKPNLDAVYYLNVSQLLAKGFVPWRDITTPYPYISYFLLAPFAAFISGAYLFKFGLTVLFIILSIAARFVYLIGYYFFKEKWVAHICVFVFLLSVYVYEGTMYVLEPFVLFWGLPAVWCVLSSNGRRLWLLSSGLLCGVAMFSKQYGLGFLPLCFLSILLCYRPSVGWGVSWRKDLPVLYRQFGWIMAGFFGVVFLYFAVALSLGGGKSVFARFINQSYNDTFVRVSVLVGTLKLFLITSGFVFLPLIFFCKLERGLRWVFLFCFCGLGGFSLTLYFAPYAHYLILLTPFSAFLFGGLCVLAKNRTLFFRRGVWIVSALFLVALLLCVVKTAARLVYYHTSDTAMGAVSKKLNAVILPREKTLFLPNPVLEYNAIMLYAGLVSPFVPVRPAWPTKISDLDRMENIQLINADHIVVSRDHIESVIMDDFRRSYLQRYFAENKSFADVKFVLLSRVVPSD
jgi:hypothetical protein